MNKGNLKITMLGTGNASVTEYYNTCFILSDSNSYFLVDAGGGNQILRILKEQKIALTDIHHLFVTHSHSDHILGVVWLVRMIGQLMNKNSYDGVLNIYANEETAEGLKVICKCVLASKITKLFGDRIEIITLKDGDTHTILDREITFFDIKSTKLSQFAFEIKEEKLLFCGDEPLKEELYHKLQNVDYLLHEAFCMYSERDKFKPYEKHHSTVKDACALAESFKIKNLILMHTEDSHRDDKKKLYSAEGKEYYSGNLIIPCDSESISIEH